MKDLNPVCSVHNLPDVGCRQTLSTSKFSRATILSNYLDIAGFISAMRIGILAPRSSIFSFGYDLYALNIFIVVLHDTWKINKKNLIDT